MSKWRIGGVCPVCNKPVRVESGIVFMAHDIGCCPHCGHQPKKTSWFSCEWPQLPIRYLGVWPFGRWVTKRPAEESRPVVSLGQGEYTREVHGDELLDPGVGGRAVTS